MKALFKIGAIAATAVTVGVAPALAAPPSGPTGSIALAPQALARSSTGPSFGDDVVFATSVEGKVSSQAMVYVSVVCRQDGWIVYQNAGSPDAVFPLVDLPGQGLEWDGAAAACVGSLVYRVEKGKSAEITVLGTVDFDVAGSA